MFLIERCELGIQDIEWNWMGNFYLIIDQWIYLVWQKNILLFREEHVIITIGLEFFCSLATYLTICVISYNDLSYLKLRTHTRNIPL